MIVVADTSGIIAASDRNAPESRACQEIMRDAGTVVVSTLVLTEVDHMAKTRFGSQSRTMIIDFVLGQARSGRFQIPAVSLEILGTARAVQHQYAGLDLDLTDAVMVALAAEYRTDAVLTLDRCDFRAMRPLTSHQWFRLLPDDLEP